MAGEVNNTPPHKWPTFFEWSTLKNTYFGFANLATLQIFKEK